ncbi:TPA: hypothetical protein ACGO2P_002115, partial [Streptococcus suis]
YICMKYIKKIIDFNKTVYFNFRYLPIKYAVKMPIKIRGNVRTKLKKGDIIFQDDSNVYAGMLKLGYNGTPFISQNNESCIIIQGGGRLIIGSNVVIGEGFNIYIDSGTLTFMDDVYCNKNLLIQCVNQITVEEQALIGWGVAIRDTDGHILSGNIEKKNSKIVIGRKSWIAADCTVLKGTRVSQGSVIGTKSLVLGLQMAETNCMAVGIPAKIKKRNITLND